MSENWKQWAPLPSLSPKYCLENIVEDYDGISIILYAYQNETSRILLRMSSLFAYAVTKNSCNGKFFADLQEKYGSQYHNAWTFFEISNSDFLKWIDEQSYGIASDWARKETPMQHFCIITTQEVIDIMAYREPKVILLG